MKIELLEGLSLEPGSPVHAYSWVWAGSKGKDKHGALGEGGTGEGGMERRWELGIVTGPSKPVPLLCSFPHCCPTSLQRGLSSHPSQPFRSHWWRGGISDSLQLGLQGQ